MKIRPRGIDPDAIAIRQRTRQITRLIRRMPRRRETLPQVASYQAVLARCGEMLERDGEAAYGPVRALLDGKYAALVAKHGQ